MRILITGAGGQLGTDLARVATGHGRHEITAASRTQIDVADRDSVLSAVLGLRPELIFHAAAWTAVDACETDRDRAWRVNALGCRHVAESARLAGAHLVSVSTDYVFDGTSPHPYNEWDRPSPLSVYGKSKLAGEDEVKAIVPGATIVRTSWVCGPHGTNMLKRILDLARSGRPLRFVDDQRGCPTFTDDLAGMLIQLGLSRRPGLFHVTNQGATTWFQFARDVVAAAGAGPEPVQPIATARTGPAPSGPPTGQLSPRQRRSPIGRDQTVAGSPRTSRADGKNARGPIAHLRGNPRMRHHSTPDPVQIGVIGVGYVGLTTAACLSHLGYRVTAVDVDEMKVERMRRGESPILEQGLGALIQEGLSRRLLSFTTDTVEAASGADFVFLCVPTPQGADGSADLRFVEEAAAQIAPHLKTDAVVVTKSTVPVGSANAVVEALGRPDTSVVSNPEFLREGNAVHDWLHPDRVVIGSVDRQAAEKLAALYEPLGAPVIITDPASSETIKYACNAFLAAKVSFVNAIANLCAAVGADAVDVIRGMSFDRRIGADHLAPGPGWGGSCFPKDTRALIRIAEDHGYDFALFREAVAANEDQFDRVADQVQSVAGGRLQGVTVAAWGLTFKAATDDLRDSPALSVLHRVRRAGGHRQGLRSHPAPPLERSPVRTGPASGRRSV